VPDHDRDAEIFLDPDIRSVIREERIHLIDWSVIGANTDWDSIEKKMY